MRDAIYWTIPKKEDNIFQQGEIWHRKIWLTKSKYVECFKQFQVQIKEQKEQYQANKKEYQRIIELHINTLKKQLEDDSLDPTDRKRVNWLINNFTADNIKRHLNNDYFLPCPENADDFTWEKQIEDLKKMEQFLTKYEIYLVQQTRESIVFNYHVPDNIIISVNDYLFNYQNVWYEVADYQRKSWNVLEITAEYSIYWNDYWYLLNANANGVIHNLPSEIIGEEICMCPAFTEAESTVFSTFTVNYELKFSLWLNQAKNNKWRSDFALANSNDSDFPWLRIGPWERQNHPLNNNKLGNLIASNCCLFTITSACLKEWWGIGVKHVENIPALAYGKDHDTRKETNLPNWIEQVLPSEDYLHCYANHIQATLCWRERVIWKGNFYPLRELKIIETSNLSGIEVSFHVGSQQIASVKESIFIKAGSDQEGALSLIMNTIVSTATAAAAGFVKGGPVGAATGAGLSLLGTTLRNGAQAVVGLNQTQTFSQEYTVDEFFHKYMRSGLKPIQITLEINDELNNRYLANKIIKQGGENNQYFNVVNFGPLLDSMGYRKFHFHTLNMKSLIGDNSSQEWFLEQLESGVQLVSSSKNLIEWYQLKLPRNRTKGLGSSCPGSLDVMEIKKTRETLMTSDITNADYSNQDYIGSPDSNIWEELNRANNNCHVSSSPFPNNCLGCLCGGGSHGNANYSFSRTYNFSSGGRVYLKTRGSGEQMITIPEGGGTIIFEAHGNTATLTLEKTETVSRHISGEPPEGFGRPPENYAPTGSGLPEDIFDPDTSPDINEPDTIGDPGPGEPEPPTVEPDIVPDIDPPPDPDLPPDTDTSQDQDNDQDKGDRDPPKDDEEKPEDFD
ncbi:MAG: hypothetical protein MRERV_8c056 [Mycoplasmataceae bacterium RV_VA103A]|nr:MAG: hypothetical protein MRERV_8c056 [Mycoplasmataceae bacterium RV_VA103A]